MQQFADVFSLRRFTCMNTCDSQDLDSYIWFYYNQGFSIIPLGVNKRNDPKAPSLDSWKTYHQRRPTKEEIQEWINQGLFKNIGVICGKVSDNLVVIDIDDAKIPELVDLRLNLMFDKGIWVVKTGKGWHLYFKHHSNPGGIKKPLKYKIEYRANRGYVAAPPSIHPNGKTYHFYNNKDKKDLPEIQKTDVKNIFQGLKSKIGKAWNIQETKPKNFSSGDISTNAPRTGYPACVEAALKQVTKPPMRYYTIYGIASAFYFNKIPKEMAMQRIKKFNMEKCVPSHENSIVEQAVNGAYQPEAKRYGCEFWIDQAQLCPYESIDQCPYGNKKLKRELAKKYKIFKYSEKTNPDTKEKYYVRTGVKYPNLGDLILNEYDFNFITINDTKEIYYYKSGKYHVLGENIIRSLAEDYMDELTSKHGKNEVVDYIRDKHYVDRTDFNVQKHLVNLKNGIYDLRKKQLIPHNPKHLFINEIPVEYDPEADCPNIKKILGEVIEEKNISCIQEFIGYCLYRDYPLHKAFMFLGAGKNGKSTVINLITNFLGRKNIANKELQQLTYDKFSRAKLFGKLLNAAADISDSALSTTGPFKGLTGGDYLDAEKKFMDSFEFKNYAKMLFSANTLPKTNDDSYAFYRRWILINFPHTFDGKKCDPHILDKICTPKELSGLFNWAIEGLMRLLKNNEFTYEKTVEEIREQYKTLSDPVFSFAQKYITTNTTKYIEKNEVYRQFAIWCKDNDLPVTPKNMFTQDLQMHLPSMKPGRKRIAGKLEQVYNYIEWQKNEKSEEKTSNPEHPSQQEGFF